MENCISRTIFENGKALILRATWPRRRCFSKTIVCENTDVLPKEPTCSSFPRNTAPPLKIYSGYELVAAHVVCVELLNTVPQFLTAFILLNAMWLRCTIRSATMNK